MVESGDEGVVSAKEGRGGGGEGGCVLLRTGLGMMRWRAFFREDWRPSMWDVGGEEGGELYPAPNKMIVFDPLYKE